ncbi:MAG: hypothetical protein EA424_03720 [Planctomycetaceae bacterium]|nr:MAG: hypothetical protein EA424_03720 [Planctomycetaceae bacterium]
MADTKVTFKKDLLIVENSDLIRAARTPAAKQLLHISPLCVATEINLSGVRTDTALEIKLVKAARDKTDAIQKASKASPAGTSEDSNCWSPSKAGKRQPLPKRTKTPQKISTSWAMQRSPRRVMRRINVRTRYERCGMR